MSSTMFSGAHDFTFSNSFNQTINIASGSGIEKLLKASMPEAFHDSGARDPPRCHPGTRLDYIDRVSSWGSGTSQHSEHILWMQGPAGVGKSAIAQSCAELLVKQKRLGAAFFFSRPNQRDDPACLFTSISYQIATRSPSFSNIVDRCVQNDPTLVKKSIAQQFNALLVDPLKEMKEAREDMKGYVIIVDGLDECAGIKAQQEIIETVAKSVGEATTPFRWAFFSRPESNIIASLTSDETRPLSIHLELPVSREIEHEILLYLTSELEKIRKERGLPSLWPSEKDLGDLVDQSAGLFIYAPSVIRFVGERDSQGPMEQLRLILLLIKQTGDNTGSDHPLSQLHLFYMLIMRRVPSKILSTVLSILLLDNTTPKFPADDAYNKVQTIAFCLSLSEYQVENACATLRSVLNFDSQTIRFYHASFMDFLQDSGHSKEFHIYGDCLDTVRQTLLERLNNVHAQNTVLSGKLTLKTKLTPGSGYDSHTIYRYLVNSFFLLCSHPRPLLPSTAAGLVEIPFDTLRRLYGWYPGFGGSEIVPKNLRQNLPIGLRDRVIRRSHNPILYFSRPSNVEELSPYIIGQGRNKVLWWGGDDPKFASYPVFLKFWIR